MIVLFTILALILGLAYGLSGLELPLLTFLSQHTDLVLYLLMFSVGISVGMHRGLFRKIREYHIRIFIIPFGIILGSLVGGLVPPSSTFPWVRGRPLPAAWAGTAWRAPPSARLAVLNWAAWPFSAT